MHDLQVIIDRVNNNQINLTQLKFWADRNNFTTEEIERLAEESVSQKMKVRNRKALIFACYYLIFTNLISAAICVFWGHN